jgi:NADH:ubiquinone oxidoreductase subunit 5 (subunit L)/multisubunit Na+/H+ antiporter MnhA subunit
LTALVGHAELHLAPTALQGLTVISLLLAVGGVLWGYGIYRRAPAAEPLRRLGPLYTGMVNLWYVNAFFVWLAHRVVLAFGALAARFDKGVVDGGLVDGTAWLTGRLGQTFRKVSAGPLPGQLQYYALAIFIIAALVILGLTASDYLHLVRMGVTR